MPQIPGWCLARRLRLTPQGVAHRDLWFVNGRTPRSPATARPPLGWRGVRHASSARDKPLPRATGRRRWIPFLEKLFLGEFLYSGCRKKNKHKVAGSDCRYPITSLDHSSKKCLETHELIPFCSKPNRVPNGTLPGTGTPSIGAGGPAGGRPGRSSPGVAVGSLRSCGERAGRPQDPLRVSATDARCRASGNPDAAGKGCQPRPRAGRVPALPAAAEGGRRRSRNAHTRGPAGPARMCDKNLISREKYF